MFRGCYDALRVDDFRRLKPAGATHADYAIDRGNEFEAFFASVRQVLSNSGIAIELAQAEWGLGQWEINFCHKPALETADQHVLFKLAIRQLARDQGFAVTFMPRPVAEDIDSSCHIHLSLSTSSGDPAFWDDDSREHMSPTMCSALAGVLTRLPECMAFYAPTVNSYRRLAPYSMAGYGQTWGFDNRTVSCRVAGDSPGALRFELRIPGADVNPYLAIGALLAAALDGLENETALDPAVEGSSYDRSIRQLPRSLEEAADSLASSDWARRAFGDRVVDHYVIAASYEAEQFRNAVTDWEVQRYFDVI